MVAQKQLHLKIRQKEDMGYVLSHVAIRHSVNPSYTEKTGMYLPIRKGTTPVLVKIAMSSFWRVFNN